MWNCLTLLIAAERPEVDFGLALVAASKAGSDMLRKVSRRNEKALSDDEQVGH